MKLNLESIVCTGAIALAAFGVRAAAPEAEGISSGAIETWIGELEKLDHPRDFCIMRHGRWVMQGGWRGVVRNEGQQDAAANAAAGRTPIGGLTRLLMLAAAGIAVDRDELKDDAALEALLLRMMRDSADGVAAADELSERIEQSVGEATSTYLVTHFLNRLEGPLCHNWTAQAQARDKRLMQGADGVAIEARNLARIGDVFLHNGLSGKRRLISEAWLKDHPVRTVAYGGNVLVVSPEKDAVVAVLTAAKEPQAILAATERLLATFAAQPLPENAAAAQRLEARRRTLALPAGQMEKSVRKAMPPSFGQQHEVLRLAPHGNIHRNSEGDLVKLNDGRLMLMWSRMMGSNADDAKSHICRRYSSDGGKTWTDDEEVFATPAGSFNVMCVSLLRLRSGRIALGYLEKFSDGDCRPYFYVSSDEGRTWTDKVKVVSDAYRGYYVFNNARLVQLKSGRLVFAGSSHGGKLGACITNWLSDDEGRTWRPAKNHITARKPNGGALRMEEPGSVQLADGRVMTYFRTDADWQYASYSSDDGETWGPAAPSSLRSPRSPATIERLSDGRLAAVWNDHETYPEYRFLYPYHNGGRMPLTIGFSSDEGRTWRNRVDLEVADWNCYIFVREYDRTLYIGYCVGDGMRTMRVIAAPLGEFAAK